MKKDKQDIDFVYAVVYYLDKDDDLEEYTIDSVWSDGKDAIKRVNFIYSHFYQDYKPSENTHYKLFLDDEWEYPESTTVNLVNDSDEILVQGYSVAIKRVPFNFKKFLG